MIEDQQVTQVDENDNVIGLKPKSDFNDGRLIHRSSYLLVLNSKGQTLLQKRLLTKKWHAGKWTFPVAGTVENETYEECMKRQIKEALGIQLTFKKLFKYHHFDNVDRAFKTVFVVNSESTQLVLKKNYAEDFTWVDLQELKKDLSKNPQKYAPPFLTGMKIFFDQYPNYLPLDKLITY